MKFSGGVKNITVAKAELYRAIEIITKDGALTDDQKASYIDTKKVYFGGEGFYQLIVNAEFYGEKVTVTTSATGVLNNEVVYGYTVKNSNGDSVSEADVLPVGTYTVTLKDGAVTVTK